MSLQSPNNQGPLTACWSDGQEIFAYPQNSPMLPTAPPAAGLTAEVSVEFHHGWAALDHGDEASRPLDFDYAQPVTAITALPVCFQLGPQYDVPPYQPLGAGEHPIIQDARDHDRRSVRPKVKPTCAACKKGFYRIQELKRHRKDVHEPPRHCPFCTSRWTRPGKIKQHIKSSHRDKFTANLLGELETLRGKEIVEFLKRYYSYGLEVGTMPNIASLDFPGFPYLR